MRHVNKLIPVEILVFVFSLLFGTLYYNTLNNTSSQIAAENNGMVHPHFTQLELAKRFAISLTYRTISESPSQIINHRSAFLALHKYIEQTFPLVHKLEKKKMGVDALSLVYIWKGKNYQKETDKPIILSSHLDVVPVPADTLDLWSHDPFGGVIADEFIWVWIRTIFYFNS